MAKKSSASTYLELLYESLRTAMQVEGKLKGESLFLSALEMTKNSLLQVLAKSAMGPSLLSEGDLRELLDGGTVMESAEPNRYALTARGIWEVESRAGRLSEKKIVDYVDSKFFLKAAQPRRLSERERVILLGFAAARCFGQEQSLDLHQSDSVKEKWKEIFLRCYDTLREMGLISKLAREELFGKKIGNEHPVSNLVRHTDAMPPKTKGLYRALGNQKYCLEVVADGNIDPDRLTFVFALILGPSPEPSKLTAVVALSQKIANDDCIYIYDFGHRKFFGVPVDESVRNCIMRAGGLV